MESSFVAFSMTRSYPRATGEPTCASDRLLCTLGDHSIARRTPIPPRRAISSSRPTTIILSRARRNTSADRCASGLPSGWPGPY